MATGAQRKALVTYRNARRRLAQAETALLEALSAGETDVAKLEGARAQAIAAMAKARLAALGRGDGFDLLSTRHPLLLLPVRLETRFAWPDGRGGWSFAPVAGQLRSLLVRVFPDDVHDDGHEPELTDLEQKVLARLDKQLALASDHRDLDVAWAEAIRLVGTARAGWLGELLARRSVPGRRPGRASRPTVARLLPDAWTAIAELDDGDVRSARSAPVAEPLETGPSPDGMAWMTDFGAALAAGMAVVVPDLPDTLTEVVRLVVVGARGTRDPAETAAELEALLDAQHHTRGLELLSPGTPTNSLPGARARFSSRPAVEDVVALERRRFLIGLRPDPLCLPGDGTDGTALADALGIPGRTFAFVARADGTGLRDGQDLRLVLAAATRRRLAALLDGILDPAQVAELVGLAVDVVDPVGPLPALRVGSQPYGVLPVLLRDPEPVAGSFAARVLPLLDALRARWAPAADRVPWVGEPGSDPGATLVRILQRDAVAQRIAFRPMLGPQLADEVVAGLGPRTRVGAQRAAAAAAIDALGGGGAAGSGLLRALHLAFAPSLTAPLVEPDDPEAGPSQRAAAYLELAAATWPDRLALHDYAGAERPHALLFALARLAMLERADDHARSALTAGAPAPASWDDETVDAGRDPYATPLGRLEAPDPLDPLASIAFHLSEAGRDVYALDDVRSALRRLKLRPPALLEELLRSSLGLFGHRLDPWFTAVASERLRELRGDPQSASGLSVGAFGVVERIRMAPRRADPAVKGAFSNPFNGGFVHAPSANHGAAAAVLRSVHLAHAAAGHGEAFGVDLSSSRVRVALEVLEGIRAGQPLAALLGYRLERGLAADGLQRLIEDVRAAAPLVANRLTPAGTAPAQAVAATNVADGLTVLAQAGYDGASPPAAATLLASNAALGTLTSDEEAGLDRALAAVADALDAVADLALSESVFQAVQGNPVRAGAAVDGLAGMAPPPAEPGVVRTPRTGVGVTHRLVVLLGDATDVDGWAATPRALAEPRLEAWAQAVLPAPDRIVVRARTVDAEGAATDLAAMTLAELHEAAVDAGSPALALGALDLVLQAAPLETRLLALVEPQRPDDAADATLELVLGRSAGDDPATFSVAETLEIARSLREAITRARPLAPRDLSATDAGPPAGVASGELAARAADARSALATAIAALDTAIAGDASATLREALFAADRFGVPGAVPASVRDTPGTTHAAAGARARELAALRDQAVAAVAELRRRDAAATQAAADAADVVVAVFGEGFVVLPALAPASGATGAFAAAARPAGATPAAARTWLARMAPVREAVGALDAVLGHVDAVGAAVPALHVGQLGDAAGERWTALPPTAGATIPGGRVSLVAMTPGAALAQGTVAGLFVDEWVEVVPSTHETTSVAFHLEAPSAAAPQTWLLGVPPASLEAWTASDALRVVDEALDLARMRLVDLDDVPELGQLLPALVTAENPDEDAIGLDIEVLTREGP